MKVPFKETPHPNSEPAALFIFVHSIHIKLLYKKYTAQNEKLSSTNRGMMLNYLVSWKRAICVTDYIPESQIKERLHVFPYWNRMNPGLSLITSSTKRDDIITVSTTDMALIQTGPALTHTMWFWANESDPVTNAAVVKFRACANHRKCLERAWLP